MHAAACRDAALGCQAHLNCLPYQAYAISTRWSDMRGESIVAGLATARRYHFCLCPPHTHTAKRKSTSYFRTCELENKNEKSNVSIGALFCPVYPPIVKCRGDGAVVVIRGRVTPACETIVFFARVRLSTVELYVFVAPLLLPMYVSLRHYNSATFFVICG